MKPVWMSSSRPSVPGLHWARDEVTVSTRRVDVCIQSPSRTHPLSSTGRSIVTLPAPPWGDTREVWLLSGGLGYLGPLMVIRPHIPVYAVTRSSQILYILILCCDTCWTYRVPWIVLSLFLPPLVVASRPARSPVWLTGSWTWTPAGSSGVTRGPSSMQSQRPGTRLTQEQEVCWLL